MPSSYDDTPDLADIDPKLLACFGTCESNASLASTMTSFHAGALRDTSNYCEQTAQCMSGFLAEQANTVAFCFPLQRWTERWFVASDHSSGAELLGYRRDSYTSPSRRIIIDGAAKREPGRDTAQQCTFSVGERGSGRRVLLAAPSDAQAHAWVASLNAMLQSRRPSPDPGRPPSPSLGCQD